MPATPLRLQVAAGEVRIGPEGGISGVEYRDRPGQTYLRSWVPRTASVAGLSSDWVQTRRTEDADECEVSYAWRANRRLRLQIRHAVEPVWSERWVLELAEDVDPGTELEVDELVADLVSGPAMVTRCATAGAEAWFAVLPVAGTGPLLGVRLQSGSVVALDSVAPGSARLRSGPVRLRPGQRYAINWLLAWYPTSLQFQQHRASVLPAAEALTVGEVWDLASDPDQVVLAPDELTVRTGDRSTEITAATPGRFRIELRSARGTVLAEVSWVPPLAEVVARRARDLLATSPRTRAGTPRLAEAASVVVVQYALGAGLVDDPDTASDAVELYVGELLDGPERGQAGLDPFSRIVVAREVVRGGDPALLDLPAAGDGPGTGLAAAQCALASIVAGRQPAALRLDGPDAERALLAPATVGDVALSDYVRRLGTELGAGLGGRDLAGPSAAGLAGTGSTGVGLPGVGLPGSGATAYRVALLGLVPEALGAELEREWGVSVPTLADRAGTALLAEPELPVDALAWLCVAEPQRS